MKAGSSYASILRGVSQQVPQERTEGQHTEQVNMLSDPVNGLARRHGSLWQAEYNTGITGASNQHIVTDTAETRSLDFSSNGKDYLLVYRKGARTAGLSSLPALLCYNKTDKVFVPTVSADTGMLPLENNGVAAVTAVGKYLFLTANATPIVGSTTATWDTVENHRKAVVWIRGGAYSRTYTIKAYTNSGVRTASYTTPASSYPGTLTTADIAATDPEYTKKVNDRVNAYNAAVTAWIGTSTAAIQPEAIAAQLATQLNALIATMAEVVGSHICFVGSRLVQTLEVDDGGDGSLIRAVAGEIASADKTSVVHFPGKVVKVRSASSQESYYLTAVAKGSSGVSGYQEVSWVEGAGEISTITGGLFYATVHNGTLYAASSNTALTALVPGDHPTFQASAKGDSNTSPMPFFVGRQVSYLGTFQNRLLVGCGGVLALSKTEDYLNFFRSTVLTLPADDPFEMLPTGSESDVLRHSTLYDQDLVVFGDRRQYVISGNTALSPTSASMPVLANYEGVADTAPVAAGGIIFYAKRAEASSSLHQIQPGQNNKSPESFPASSQLDDYIVGGVADMVVATGTPSIVCLRSTVNRNALFTFTYLDRADGRKLDAWARWEFNAVLGSLLGMSVTKAGVVAMSLRVGANGKFMLVADLIPTETKLSNYPYLDSMRSQSKLDLPDHSVQPTSGDSWAVAIATGTRKFTGAPLTNAAAIAGYTGDKLVGALQDAYFVPTNPYVRDTKGKAVLSGRTTVAKLTVALKNSIGLKWAVSYFETTTTGEHNGRVTGLPINVIGTEPVSTGTYSVPIGRETNDYTLRISARRWYPLTVTALEWVGQLFNRIPRV